MPFSRRLGEPDEIPVGVLNPGDQLVAGGQTGRLDKSDDAPGTKRFVEIRSYNLKPGTRGQFHRLVVEQSMPSLHRWKVDVVAYGPSLHDDDSYYLVRAYASLEDRERSQEAFYGSDEWRAGPRQAIVDCIESDTSVVIEMDSGTLDGLRR